MRTKRAPRPRRRLRTRATRGQGAGSYSRIPLVAWLSGFGVKRYALCVKRYALRFRVGVTIICQTRVRVRVRVSVRVRVRVSVRVRVRVSVRARSRTVLPYPSGSLACCHVCACVMCIE